MPSTTALNVMIDRDVIDRVYWNPHPHLMLFLKDIAEASTNVRIAADGATLITGQESDFQITAFALLPSPIVSFSMIREFPICNSACMIWPSVRRATCDVRRATCGRAGRAGMPER